MTMVDLPMNVVYAVCLVGFAAMTFRSLQVALIHYRRGYSVLERPETTILDTLIPSPMLKIIFLRLWPAGFPSPSPWPDRPSSTSCGPAARRPSW